MKIIRYISVATVFLFICALGFIFLGGRSLSYSQEKEESILSASVEKKSFVIEVQTIGELEAARSTNIASDLRGDLGKIIYIISDGSSVKAGDILVKLDPTPFEEQLEELQRQLNEQKGKIEILDRLLKWETYQGELEVNAAEIEMEAADLEINKLILGDGPIEKSQLNSVMRKSKTAYDELKGYMADFEELKESEYFNPHEIKLAQKNFEEVSEEYFQAKMYYDNFIIYTHPIQLKKAENVLKRSQNKHDEIIKAGGFKVAKAKLQIEQAYQEYNELQGQVKNIENQIRLTTIKASSPGMVVLKEDFRGGQKRKPRLGDVVVKNQTILDLPYLENMLLKTKVREMDLFKIQIGTAATILIDAYPELSLEGKIQSIGILAFSDLSKTGDEKYFEVIAKLDASDQRLRPGMTARAIFHSERIENQIAIPPHAIYEFKKQTYCFVIKDGKCSAVPILVGPYNDEWIVIKGGLEEGDKVLLSCPPLSEVVNADDLREK